MITSTANKKVKQVIAWQGKAKERRKSKVFLTEGIKMFEETQEGQILEVYVSQEQEEKLSDSGIGDFDFVFIDGAKSHYRRFLDSALPLCRKGALIVSDNILMRAATVSEEYDTGRKHKTNRKKMREYVEYICSSRELETSLMSVGDGLAVSIYRGENEERRF